MTTAPDPASSLQAKVGDFLETLDPAELELFAEIIERANGADVEGYSASMTQLKGEAMTFQMLSSSVSDVMKNFGQALNTAARGG